jgi:uncharacterized LabA/DUF88 family protein
MEENNYAFIDSQNVNLEIRRLGWILDFKKFRIYLKEKYGINKAYIFIGYIKENKRLYENLLSFGYILIFKTVVRNKDGTIKGNCDAELVLHTMTEYQNYEKTLIISGDGDFACLIEYLRKRDKLLYAMIPNSYSYSFLLDEAAKGQIVHMNNLKDKLAYKNEKAPPKDET